MSNSKKHKSRRIKLKKRDEKAICKFQKLINAAVESAINYSESAPITESELKDKLESRLKNLARYWRERSGFILDEPEQE